MKRYILILCGVVLVLMPASLPAERPRKEPKVDNIILMVGDGMGLAHVTALMLENQYRPINMERAPVTGLVKTYSANNRVTDSGAAGTAFATGEKTNNSHLGVDTAGEPLPTILEKADDRGMATGLVGTISITHATPGAFYAHSSDRRDYAKVTPGLLETDIDVAIGGGRDLLTKRRDGLNIVNELEERGYLMAESLEELDGVSEGRAMAIYPGGTYDIPLITKGRDPEFLPRATAKALEILTNNSRGKGFFLMVEGSLIDMVCHSNDAAGMLAEMRDFDNAVGVALDYAETHPGTLVIILADHETGGLALPSGKEDFHLPDSGIKFQWASKSHTATMVPLFAYGPRAEYFGGVLENDEVGRRMQQVLGLR